MLNGHALLCVTDLPQCCYGDNEQAIGNWYLHNGGSVVESQENASDIYVIRGLGQVGLYWNTSQTGVFRCEIPDACGITQTLLVSVRTQQDGSPSTSSSATVAGVVVGVLFVLVIVVAGVVLLVASVRRWVLNSFIVLILHYV